MKKLIASAGLAATAFAASNAQAVIDVGAAATSITTDGSAAMVTIGTAMVTISVVALVFKWAKAAIFG